VTETLLRADAPGDAELISAVRGGDLSAYGELFERHAEAARRLARQLVSTGDADDLVSDAFAKVLTVLQRGGGPDLAFRAYLLTAVRRLHVDKIRANKRLTTTDEMEKFDPGVPFRDTAVEGFENAAAAKAFASLPERWQLVLWHLEVEGQKPADIAPLLGMSPNSVSALAYRAREGLRQAFLTQHAQEAEEDTCRWTQGNLGAYIRNGISKRDAGKVEAHLDECVKCMGVYLELTEVNSNLAAILGPLLLGSAGASYVAATAAAASKGAIILFLDRAKDTLANNVPAAVAGSAAAVAAVAAGAFLTLHDTGVHTEAGNPPAAPPASSAPQPGPPKAPTPPKTHTPKPPPVTPPALTPTPTLPTPTLPPPTQPPAVTPTPPAPPPTHTTKPPPPNSAPQPNTNSVVSLDVAAGDSLTVDVDALVTDPDGDPVWFLSVGADGAVHGSVKIGPGPRTTAPRSVAPAAPRSLARPTTFTYTPLLSWAGVDTLTYVVTDDAHHRATGKVRITTPNTAPVSHDFAVSTPFNKAVRLDVLAHASDVNIPGTDQRLTPTITAQPAHGTVEVNADNTITYQPSPQFPGGIDTFTYRISDHAGGSDTANVTVTVVPAPPVNHDPVAADDSVSLDVGQSLTFDPRTNDSDPDGDALTITDLGALPDGVNAEIVGAGTGLEVTGVRSGTWTFDYTVSDGHGGTDTAQVTVDVPKPSGDLTLDLLDVVPHGNLFFVTVTTSGYPAGGNATVDISLAGLLAQEFPEPQCVLVNDSLLRCSVSADQPDVTGIKVNPQGPQIVPGVTATVTADDFTDSDGSGNNTRTWPLLAAVLGRLR
jgi:RNA polymerase sigma factor (sigma-70 family)